MGGDSKSKAKPKSAGGSASKAQQPSLLTFGASGMDPAIASQLRAGGLLGSAMPAGYYQPMTVPLIQTPDQVAAYLKSIGKTPSTDGSSGGGGGRKDKPRGPRGIGEGAW